MKKIYYITLNKYIPFISHNIKLLLKDKKFALLIVETLDNFIKCLIFNKSEFQKIFFFVNHLLSISYIQAR